MKLDAFAALIDSMPVGDPNDQATQIGPMVSQRQRDRVEGYIAGFETERGPCGGASGGPKG